MLEFINTYILGNLTPVFLMAAGIYFLFRLKFFYIRHPIKVLSAMLEKNKSAGISPFRAVTLALAGTLGVGNIVGVASAIAMGGYGAIFWMWVSALLAMILKYAEIVLAVSHRRTDPVSGEHYGGAMYYIRDLFNCRGHELCGILLAGVFALFCIINSLTMGCVVQINAISRSFMGVFDLSPVLIGAATALVCVFIISGNAKKISGFTEKIIPVITLGYLGVSVAALSARPDQIGDAFRVIFEQAFDFRSAAGGVLGFMFSRAMRLGSMRGLMSNEAGCGTAPTAHAASDTNSPSKQGFWGIFEVFVDTIVLCTITALVIIIGRVDGYENDPMMMTIKAYSSLLGEWSSYFICFSVLLFGVSTIICWAHYGKECVRYLSKSKTLQTIFIIVFTLFIFIGAVSAPESIWNAADFALGIMTVINVPVLCAMSGEVVVQTERFLKSAAVNRGNRKSLNKLNTKTDGEKKES